MQVLVIGGGGREHAIAWKVAQTADKVFVAPGNAGTNCEPGIENIAIAADNIEELLAFAKQQDIDLTIVGPELPLTLGIVDTFTDAGLLCCGPSKACAQLEGSKAFAKAFMQRHNIPTAAYQSFTDLPSAMAYVKTEGFPIVIKADGLAAGKGVIIAQSLEEAEQTLETMFSGDAFADAGKKVVIEAFLTGQEASFIALCDGETVLPFASSQDHKARDNGDLGPNTGGMGAYSPAPVVTRELHQRIIDEVMYPVVKGMKAEGMPYSGFLYAGLMIKDDGSFHVLEYNCRLGDPETQVLLLRLQSDLTALCQAACQGKLASQTTQWDPKPALGVVIAAKGYPAAYPKGDAIGGLDTELGEGKKVFHAGTIEQNGNVLSNGGRVLCACALGDNFVDAQTQAYQVVNTISWDNAYYRTDIGYRVCE